MSAPVFGLRKTWVDTVPGIELVQIHYTWSPPGTPPDWAGAEEQVLTGGTGPLRTAVLEVPRTVGGASDYALHHFFFVVGGAGRAASPVYTEDIVAREVTYEDPAGQYTAVGLVWSAVQEPPEPGVPNYTSTTMDGLPFESPGAAPEHADIYEFVRAQPLPHVFRGRVWGVRGTAVRYGYHLIRQGLPDPADDAESWTDNGGRGWTVTL
ncbi:hypothetical protein GCM10020358_35500 [Amorphoplanes nipponensis]|uniref:Uncharacterized protein n=1 Tax=Actinoplanes nipponensis TaxID=135950 RepID=A0A919JQL4_9ACTN|nr:hypothetical protein [Actinoplanes nipponensis]GIE53622.1 hypothetical protein Ani05nite_71560 [Actinoplanes nipponensis]